VSTTTNIPPTTTPCVVSPVVGTPKVACAMSCCPAVAGNKTLVWTMSTDFASFDCPVWLSSLAGAMGVPISDLRVCEQKSGSSIVGVSASTAAQNSVQNENILCCCFSEHDAVF
jgi:hypothetical protein